MSAPKWEDGAGVNQNGTASVMGKWVPRVEPVDDVSEYRLRMLAFDRSSKASRWHRAKVEKANGRGRRTER